VCNSSRSFLSVSISSPCLRQVQNRPLDSTSVLT
jgi:hypothetical protein